MPGLFNVGKLRGTIGRDRTVRKSARYPMDTPFTNTITTDEKFESTLQELLASAHANDVRIEGGWDCNGTAGTRWDVVITRVAAAGDD